MPKEGYLRKKETQILKGLAVVAMICLHLFDRYDYSALYAPVLFFRSIPLTFYLGQLGDFCVMCFAFCTGYAHMTDSQRHKTISERLLSLFALLRIYWITLFSWLLIGRFVVHTADLPHTMYELLGNLLCFNITMNGTWWYMYAYIVIVLISPLLVKLVDNTEWKQLIIIIGTLYTVSYIVRFNIDANGLLLSKVGPLGMTVAEYLIGSFFYKYNVFAIISFVFEKKLRNMKGIVSVFLFLLIMFIRTLILPSLFFAPISGIIVMSIVLFNDLNCVKRFLSILGKYSTGIWLSHYFFINSYTNSIAFSAHYPLAILAVCVLCSIVVAFLIQLLDKAICSLSWKIRRLSEL